MDLAKLSAPPFIWLLPSLGLPSLLVPFNKASKLVLFSRCPTDVALMQTTSQGAVNLS